MGKDVRLFWDYLVSGEVVLNMLQKTIDFASTRVELTQVGNHLPWMLQNFEQLQHEEEQAELQGHISEMRAQLRLPKRPSRRIPVVEEWFAQCDKSCG